MRFLYYGNFTESWSTESYIARALERAGCSVTRWQSVGGAAFAEITDKFDVFLFAKMDGWSASPSIERINRVRKSCGKVVGWCFDLLNPSYRQERYQWASAVSGVCDLFCTTDGSMAPHLSNCKVLRQGIGDDIRPGTQKPEMACDVLFLGENYGLRDEFIKKLSSHFQRRFWHTNNIRGESLNDLMASSKVVVAPPYPYFDEYWSNRIYVVTGYGGLMIHPRIKGMEAEKWAEGNCWMYDPSEDICRVVSDALDSPLSDAIKYLGKSHCRHSFTYDRRVAVLLEWLA